MVVLGIHIGKTYTGHAELSCACWQGYFTATLDSRTYIPATPARFAVTGATSANGGLQFRRSANQNTAASSREPMSADGIAAANFKPSALCPGGLCEPVVAIKPSFARGVEKGMHQSQAIPPHLPFPIRRFFRSLRLCVDWRPIQLELLSSISANKNRC
jgi:hypothetical protein